MNLSKKAIPRGMPRGSTTLETSLFLIFINTDC